jgi:predicted  nucleic acid-binding Zn-ribbon protein
MFFSSENHITSDSYRSELLDLESELNIVKEDVNSKHIKLKEHENAISALQQELEKENTLQRSLQLEVNFVNLNC